MKSIPAELISEIDLLLGLNGRPYLRLADGQWVDTGCYEWNRYPSPGLLWRGMSPDLKQAMGQAGQQLARRDYSTDPMALMRSYILDNHPGLLEEYDDFIKRLQEAEKRITQPLEIELAVIPPDVKEAMERIHDRVRFEKGTAGDFDFDEYTDRIRELWQEESDELQSALDRLRPEFERIAAQPEQAERQRRERLDKVCAVLKGKPFVAYGDIIVAPASDQYEVLRIEETNGNNRGLRTEDIISALKELDRQYGITIHNAGFDLVVFGLARAPTGAAANRLGESLLRLCPDLGEAPKDFSKPIELWWD